MTLILSPDRSYLVVAAHARLSSGSTAALLDMAGILVDIVGVLSLFLCHGLAMGSYVVLNRSRSTGSLPSICRILRVGANWDTVHDSIRCTGSRAHSAHRDGVLTVTKETAAAARCCGD